VLGLTALILRCPLWDCERRSTSLECSSVGRNMCDRESRVFERSEKSKRVERGGRSKKEWRELSAHAKKAVMPCFKGVHCPDPHITFLITHSSIASRIPSQQLRGDPPQSLDNGYQRSWTHHLPKRRFTSTLGIYPLQTYNRLYQSM